MVSCGGNTYLARSTDEGVSWPIVNTLPASLRLPVSGGPIAAVPLQMDSENNLYIAWATTGGAGQQVLNYAVSKDLGQTWNTVANVTAPGVTSRRLPQS